MRAETESLEGLVDSLAKAMRSNARVAFVFYCLTVKMGTLGERRFWREADIPRTAGVSQCHTQTAVKG
jgi:hypothetical protein